VPQHRWDQPFSHDLPVNGKWPAFNVAEFLLAGKDPERIALLAVRGEHRYGDLQRLANAIARHLITIGLEKGDRVILLSDNSFFWVVSYLGILKAGLICVPLPTAMSAANLGYILETTEPRLVFVQAQIVQRLSSVFGAIPILTDAQVLSLSNVSLRRRPDGAPDQSCFPAVHSDDLAALMFTSGSTGRPRGVMVSHANIMANTDSIIKYLNLTELDRMMAVLPFHYCFGTSLLHTHLRVGGSLVIGSNFVYPEVVLQRLRDTACTGFAGVPSHFQLLLRASTLRKRQFPQLRYVQQAGGHLAPTYVRELKESLPETRIFVMYGQTEATSRLSYLPPELLEKKLGSIGKAIPGVTLRVLNECGLEVSPGEVGEIVGEGENVALGYWRDPGESATTFRDGKLYTGDLATTDEEGFIYVVDRAKDFLKCGGKRVSCREVEERLLELDDLVEVAVVGTPDDILGEAVQAFVVPRTHRFNGIRERLFHLCKEHLPAELVPKNIILLEELPKNAAGKVLKRVLKTMDQSSRMPESPEIQDESLVP
jgi:acyl-CoA synthetase (AMP-forming)/AMP-acid ligase II